MAILWYSYVINKVIKLLLCNPLLIHAPNIIVIEANGRLSLHICLLVPPNGLPSPRQWCNSSSISRWALLNIILPHYWQIMPPRGANDVPPRFDVTVFAWVQHRRRMASSLHRRRHDASHHWVKRDLWHAPYPINPGKLNISVILMESLVNQTSKNWHCGIIGTTVALFPLLAPSWRSVN